MSKKKNGYNGELGYNLSEEEVNKRAKAQLIIQNSFVLEDEFGNIIDIKPIDNIKKKD